MTLSAAYVREISNDQFLIMMDRAWSVKNLPMEKCGVVARKLWLRVSLSVQHVAVVLHARSYYLASD